MMNRETHAQLKRHYEALEQIQAEMEKILEKELSYKKTLQKHTDAFERADLTCDSLGYAVDDLDSVLGNLEELLSTEQQEEN